jgi:hypothetical protein
LQVPHRLRAVGEQAIVESGIPFVQSLAAEICCIHLQYSGGTRDFVQFHSPPAGFPMSNAFHSDVQPGGDFGLFEA